MISGERAVYIEEALARILNVQATEVRDYIAGNIGAARGRRTGYRFVYGTHSGHYVRDPHGTDILPEGYQAPAA